MPKTKVVNTSFMPLGKKFGGRTKGTPNKKTVSLQEKCDIVGLDPFEQMLIIASTADEQNLRFHALKELCQYLYPKRKAIEHSGEISNPYASKSYEELKELVIKKLKGEFV